MNDQLDPQAYNLARSIRKAETGGSADPYNQHGASGEFGAYQFLPSTYHNLAQKYLGDANAQPTVENQNKIAYSYIKEKKDAGYNPAQIGSMWNAGDGEPNAYKGTFSNGQPATGTNKEGVHYDVPAYATKVSQYYRQFSNQPAAQPQTTQAPTASQEPGLSDQLNQRGNDVSAALTQAGTGVGELSQGQIGAGLGDVASGALQTAGGIAGGIGDVMQKGLELIPGVKSVEKGVGSAVGALADTGLGKEVVSGVTQLAQDHPELAKDIGAAMNIASVLPMFKVVGSIPGLAKDALGTVTQNGLKKAALDEMAGVALKTNGGREFLASSAKRGLNPIQTIMDHGALPEVVEGVDGIPRYNTANAWAAMNTQPEEDALQFALKDAAPKNGGQVALADVRKNALKDVAQQFENRTDYEEAVAATNKIFDSYEKRFGENIALSKLNDLKRGVRESVNFKSDKLPSDIHYIIGQTMMNDIEKIGDKLGVKGIHDLNQKMASKIQARKLLKLMDGKQPRKTKAGLVTRAIKKGIAGGAGEAVGSIAGVPLAGTLAGMGVEGALLKNVPDSALYKLGLIGRRSNMKSISKKALLGSGLLAAQRQSQGGE